MKHLSPEIFNGVWSACPTPFDDKMRVDSTSVRRMVEHHLRLGIRGVFLAGTCGEGPWMPDRERRRLVQSTIAAARGALSVAVQVTDNSAARILDNIAFAAADGADLAVIAQPYFLMNATPSNIETLYLEAIEGSTLPVAFYDRGKHAAVVVPDEILKSLYMHPRVIAIKDSSSDPKRRAIALAARKKRPELRLLDGDEFRCDEYLAAGYDGLMLGGGVFNGFIANQILEATRAGNLQEAKRLQERMTNIMYDIYGGPKITCWLTGLKQFLVEISIFETTHGFLNYPLTRSCQAAIAEAIERDKDVLLP